MTLEIEKLFLKMLPNPCDSCIISFKFLQIWIMVYHIFSCAKMLFFKLAIRTEKEKQFFLFTLSSLFLVSITCKDLARFPLGGGVTGSETNKCCLYIEVIYIKNN
jgi:hypothetical protein